MFCDEKSYAISATIVQLVNDTGCNRHSIPFLFTFFFKPKTGLDSHLLKLNIMGRKFLTMYVFNDAEKVENQSGQ